MPVSHSPTRRFKRSFALLLAILIGACAPIAAPPQPLRSASAWITYWDFENGLRAVAEAPPKLQDVFIFAANLDRTSQPVLPAKLKVDAAWLQRMRDQRRRVWLTVVNDVAAGDADTPATVKDAAIVTSALATREQRGQHAARVVELAAQTGFDGIDIDYENLRAGDRAAFTDFIEHLAQDAHVHGLQVSVTVQPKIRETSSDGAGAMDWRALCAAADRVQVMLYNEHSGKTGPGPISSSPWIKSVLTFAQNECPRDKIVPVLKVSGAVWSGSNVRGIQYDEARTLAIASNQRIERDAHDRTPFYSYERDRMRYTVYFEDAVSLKSKTETTRRFGYDRVTLWSLGRHDPALLETLLSGDKK